MHTLTAAQHAVGVAGGNIYLDLKARLRDATAVTSFTATIDSMRAGGTLDLLLRDSVQETGGGGSTGVRVTTLTESTGSGDANFTSKFRPDGAAASFDLAAFGGLTITLRDSVYDFRNLDGAGNRTVAGLIAGKTTTGNIEIKDVEGAADTTVNGAAVTAAPIIGVLGLSDLLGTGHIDIDVDGSVTLGEITGDLRVGLIRSRGADVTLTALDSSIVDAATGDGVVPVGDANPDVVGVNVTLLAALGGIGSTANFLEINSSNLDGTVSNGLLDAEAKNGIYLTETNGDLRLKLVDSAQGDASLVTLAGSIVDGRAGAGLITDAAVISANSIDLQANGGSIGEASGGGDVEINSSRQATGDVGLEAANDIYVTEVDGTLRLVQARTPIDPSTIGGGNIHLTVRESANATSLNENLDLLVSGSVLFTENAPRAVPNGFIRAGGWVELRIGDDLIDHANTLITAGDYINIFLDDLNNGSTGDPGYGANTTLVGTLTPGAGKVTSIFGNTDVDHITLDQTTLGGYTRIYGSKTATPTGQTAPAGDGEDVFTVNKLQSMTVGTLTLDGQAGSDHYIINTSGSQGADRNYIVNVLDTGAPDDGVDVLSIYGVDSPNNGIDPSTTLPYAADDIFLLRGMTAIAGLNGNETANRPAFVALLHGSDAQAKAGTSTSVERVNYDSAINGRLEVFGLGGNDEFATDDNSAITTLDGGAGDDSFQIGQLYGSQRNTAAHLDANDVFATVATTRGWLSDGNTSPLVAEGGAGNDQFTVYSNQAVLRLEGDDGNDIFVVRAFALADTVGGTEGATKTYLDGGLTKIATFHDGIWWRTFDPNDSSNDVALPALTSGFSTAAETAIRTGGGNNQVQYNINAPVSIDGGSGFDKVVVLGTEFADHIVITDKAIYGAGLAVTYANVEVLEIDGLEGDDTFDVLSTPPGVITRVIGGLGSDTINVGGDVVGTVFAQDVEGSSGAINHLVTSGDVRYNGMTTSGVDLSVARPTQGAVIITESAGFTAVTEGGVYDTYTVALAQAPTADVYVTISAAAALSDDQKRGADTIWVSDNAADFYRHVTDHYVPGVDPTLVPKREIVLHFTPTDYAAKTVYVLAPTDGVAEGDQTVVISHSVISKDAVFDNARVRNVEVQVHDIDQPAISLIQVDPSAPNDPSGDNQTLVLEGDATTRIVDQYRVHLAIPPAAGTTVAVDITAGDARVDLSSMDSRFSVVTPRTATTPGVYRVTFTDQNYSDALVTITAVDDFAVQDAHTTVLTHTIDAAATTDLRYSNPVTGATPQSLYVKVLDNDSAGVVVRPSNGSTVLNASDPSQFDTYTLRLTTAPTAPVNIAILGDGQSNVALDSRVQLAQIGTALHGLYTGTITWDPTTRTLTRTDGSSWLDDGFLEGQLVRFNGATTGPTYKIQSIHGTTSSVLDQLTLTSTATPSLSNGVVTVTEWAPQVTFDQTNWWQDVTVKLSADPDFVLAPGAENVKSFAKQPHLLSGLQGPLQVEGGTTGADRSLRQAILLPGETNKALFGIPPQPSEATQIDVLNVYADSSVENLVGTMTSTTITGLNMSTGLNFASQGITQTAFGEPLSVPGGISFGTISIDGNGNIVSDAGFSTIEAVNVMLGEGNDKFTVTGTLKPGPDVSTGIPAVHGGITTIHGGGNSLLQVTAPFAVARVNNGADTQVTRTDGLAWADYGFVVGQTILYDNAVAGVITGLSVNMMTVGGTAVALNPTNATHVLGVYDPLTNARNQVPNPYGATPAATNTRVGGDTIIITGGGGPDSPLVVYGDTSQDGVWYQGDPTHMSLHDFGAKPWGTQLGNGSPDFIFAQAGLFHWFGNDVIDARQDAGTNPDGSLQTIGINAYGGPGDDTIYGSQTGDRLAGGSGNDTIVGERGSDLIYGDSGMNVDLITRNLTMVTSQAGVPAGTFDVIDHLVAGKDNLTGDGAGSAASANLADFADIIFGDHGVVTQDVAGPRITYVPGQPNTVPAIDARPQRIQSVGRIMALTTAEPANGANDTIYGNAGDDVLMGGTGNDMIDGGAGNDLIFGDNVSLDRTNTLGNFANPRFRALVGTQIYDTSANTSAGSALVTAAWQVDPHASTFWGDFQITLNDSNFGNDYIAGGAGNDEIFGQLGNDVIQGDGSIDLTFGSQLPAGLLANWQDGTSMVAAGTVGAANVDFRSLVGAGRDLLNNLFVHASVDNAGTDGDDYIEGGPGTDTIFGNLGQDDIIGGSSDLFSLGGAANKPRRADGSDLLFGGSGGTDIARLDAGDTSINSHASDADTIIGDNGDIFRLVGVGFNGTTQIAPPNVSSTLAGGLIKTLNGFLAFNYDDATYDSSQKIVVRAVQLIDYTPGGPDFNAALAAGDNGAADEIHGGKGDDFIYGGKGNDVLFGDGQNDSIIGGYGADWIDGGNGDDGILGDDGRIYLSRNSTSYGEPLYGIAAIPANQINLLITISSTKDSAVLNVAGELTYTADLTPDNLDPASVGSSFAQHQFPAGQRQRRHLWRARRRLDPRRRRRRCHSRRRSAGHSGLHHQLRPERQSGAGEQQHHQPLHHGERLRPSVQPG